LVGGVTASVLLTGNAIAVAMAYSPSPDSSDKAGKVLNQEQLLLLKQVCALVIPKTDTSGAAEVDSHGFIDNQLFHCHSAKDQQAVQQILIDIDFQANARHQAEFLGCTEAWQTQLLNDIEQGGASFGKQYRSQFKFLKKMICFAYYTSEVGASQELRYLAVPGGYTGSIPYKKTDAGWGSMGLAY